MMQFWGSGLVGSLVDGVVLGALLAVILVTWRGPIEFLPKKEQPEPEIKPRSRRERKLRAIAAAQPRRAGPGDYLQAWAMLGVIVASASYAVAGGHGEYGILTGTEAALRTVSDPWLLGAMTALNVLAFAAMSAVLWTILWGIGMLPLRLFYPSWAKSARLYHGTIFGIALGILIGVVTTLNHAIAGNIVGPMDLLFNF